MSGINPSASVLQRAMQRAVDRAIGHCEASVKIEGHAHPVSQTLGCVTTSSCISVQLPCAHDVASATCIPAEYSGGSHLNGAPARRCRGGTGAAMHCPGRAWPAPHGHAAGPPYGSLSLESCRWRRASPCSPPAAGKGSAKNPVSCSGLPTVCDPIVSPG